MLRSILAVIGGYLVIFVLVSPTVIFVLPALNPDVFPTLESKRSPGVEAMAVIAAISLLCTVLGGYVTALIARRSELKHALALGILLELGALYELFLNRMGRPFAFMLLISLLPIPAALLGGWLRARQRADATPGSRPAAA